MEGCSVVGTPCSREEGGKPGEGGEKVIKEQARITKFRRAAVKLNYLALDDPRIAFTSKIISQNMSAPTVEGEMLIKRALRFLRGRPVCEWSFGWQDKQTHLVGYSDSD